MIGRRVVIGGGGALIGGAGWGGESVAASARGTGDVTAGMSVGAGVAVGSFRTEDGTSGRGASSAIKPSISRRVRPQALPITLRGSPVSDAGEGYGRR